MIDRKEQATIPEPGPEQTSDLRKERPFLGRLRGLKSFKAATRIAAAAGIFTFLSLTTIIAAGTSMVSNAQGNPFVEHPNRIISDDTEAIQAHQEKIQSGEVKANDVSLVVPSLSRLQSFNSQGLEMTRFLGSGSEQEIGILFLGDRFTDNQKFLQAVATATNQIFSTEPFASNIKKFSVYALSVESTPNLDCLSSNPNYPLCNDETIKYLINKATLSARANLIQTMVLIDSVYPQGKSYIANINGPVSRYNYSLVPTAVVDGITTLHEFLHGYAGLLDEYDLGFPLQNALYLWPNCVPLPEKNWEYLGPDNPGRQFPGCRHTTNGYRDAENDIMRMGQRVLGPADMYWTMKAIKAGLSRYQLFPIPPLPNRLFLPALPVNKANP